MIWRWLKDWRNRRSALDDLRQRQRQDEATLADQNQNPLNLAKACIETGNTQAGAAHWENARQLMPNLVVDSKESLPILVGLKRFDEAEALMRERGKRHPRDTFHLTALARISEARGDIPEALTRWELARTRVKNSVEALDGCARCLLALGRLDEAEKQYDAAIRFDPRSSGGFGRALISDRRQDWAESLVRWKYMVDKFGDAHAYGHYGRALVELGRLDEAEVYLREPSRVFPREIEIAMALAYVAWRRGNLEVAGVRWAAVRAVHPYYPAGYVEGARCLVEAGQHVEADAVIRRAMEQFPDDAWPLHEFANLAHNRGEWDEAASRWAALRQRFPKEEAGYTLGAAALRAGNRAAEAAELRRDT